MKSSHRIFLGFLGGSLAFGQTPAPKPSRAAPTAADWAAVAKRPDFTGVWETAPGGRGGARGTARPAGPQLTPAYTAKAAEKAKDASLRKAEDNQTANCLPPGLPGIMGQPYPIELLMTPGQMTIIIEAYTQVRHIYTDGRPLPADPDPNFNGTSVGRWEGDTLVVESVGFADVPRGLNFPNSDKMKIVERFQLTDPDTLAIETTVVDPEALTMPYSMGSRSFKRHRSWTIAEYICEENNRNFVDQNGKAGVNLSNPLASPK
jgi:hypothetical protein